MTAQPAVSALSAAHSHSRAKIQTETEPGKKTQKETQQTQTNDEKHSRGAKHNTVSIHRPRRPESIPWPLTCTAYGAGMFSLAAGSQRGLCHWGCAGAFQQHPQPGVNSAQPPADSQQCFTHRPCRSFSISLDSVACVAQVGSRSPIPPSTARGTPCGNVPWLGWEGKGPP